MKIRPEEPKNSSTSSHDEVDPAYAKGSDSKLEAAEQARLEAAENLTLEARRDGVKDVEREAKIDHLESASDLVATAAKDPDAGKIGTFVNDDWRVQDNTKIVPAEKDDAWFEMTPMAQAKYLQQDAGTYRPEGGVRALTRQRSRGNLKERERLIDLGSTVLLKAGAPQPVPSGPRWCLHCTGLIGPEVRSVAKFCCSNHRVEFFRDKTKRDAGWVKVTDCRAADADMPFHFHERAPEATVPMSAMHAIRSNQVATYMLARKIAL